MRCHRVEPGGVIHVRAGEEHWAENDGEANFCFVELWAPPPEDTVWTEDDMAPGDAMPEPRAPERAGRLADLREPGPVRAGAFELDRLEVAPRQSREWRAHDGGEHLLYVIRGSGSARPGRAGHPDSGSRRPEVLTARAPA